MRQPATTVMLLSVDWDFFVWGGGMPDVKAFTDDRGRHVATADIFQWVQNEAVPRHAQLVEWARRVRDTAKVGVDLEREMGVRPDRGCTPVSDFMQAIHARFGLQKAHLLHADSHRTGLWATRVAARQAGRPVEVVNIDAHADLGYDENWMRKKPPGSYDCADWLHEALREGSASRATIVYPDWRAFKEWAPLLSLSNVQEMLGRTRALTWSDWLKEQHTPREVSIVNFVRSSTWTPPWTDTGFLEALPLFRTAAVTCLDPDPDAYGQEVLPSSRRPRAWTRKP